MFMIDFHTAQFITYNRQNLNEVVIGDLSSIIYKEAFKEPVVQEANETEGVPSLIVDQSVVW